MMYGFRFGSKIDSRTSADRESQNNRRRIAKIIGSYLEQQNHNKTKHLGRITYRETERSERKVSYGGVTVEM